ncbi:hypothetical protein FC36_GL002114 [Ligilactobacillus equi DSM 15833 = JCM 10991]|uniref:Transposase n=2 Tax=Ligilactobacillus equi TaxID=137357 RepID=A0A0R1TQ53_9LACO|nr:hypothetical protein FC36_GL002114 [Ligilactobacillus equi DSM 15833 = JCM 10991]
MNKLGLLKKSGSGSKPRRYGKEVVERVGAVLDEVKYKKTISKDADYWKKRSKRVEKSNELLKKKIKAYSELQEKLAQIEILEKE